MSNYHLEVHIYIYIYVYTHIFQEYDPIATFGIWRVILATVDPYGARIVQTRIPERAKDPRLFDHRPDT